MSDLTETALEEAFLMMDELAPPDALITNPVFIRHLYQWRNEDWKRTDYLRRRRGWAPK